MRRGHHMGWIMGLWWLQLHSCPGLGGLFRALPLTFPCRCWDFWPLHHAVPRCLWVLLIVMKWSSLACACVCVCVLKMHVYCLQACACVFQLYNLMCACVRAVDSVGAVKPFGPRAGNSIWHDHSEDYLCPDSYCLTDNKNRHHSLLKVNMLKQGAPPGRK